MNKSGTVVITGAAGGIGAALCNRFGVAGFSILAVDVDEKGLADLSKKLNHDNIHHVIATVDITNKDALTKKVLDGISVLGKPLKVLINNAAINKIEPFSPDSISNLERIMQVNFLAPVYATGICLEQLIQLRGTIINISSTAGFAPLYHRTSYCSSKYALNGFSEVLRTELKDKGVNVISVYPTFVKTKFSYEYNRGKGVKGVSTPMEVVSKIYSGYIKKRNHVFIGKGRMVYFLYKYLPGLYLKLMLKQQK